MIDFDDITKRFFQAVGTGQIEIYNEFSLQHELGIRLRSSVGGIF
jgi:hypothetical protein